MARKKIIAGNWKMNKNEMSRNLPGKPRSGGSRGGGSLDCGFIIQQPEWNS